MMEFDAVSAAAGGALIGLGATLLMLLNGRVAGISGIAGDVLAAGTGNRGWRIAFILGLILAPLLLLGLTGQALSPPRMPDNWAVVIVAGLLVGLGTRLGSGCTSGHGVCGIARLSPRSLTATAIFIITAVAVVTIMRHGLGV